MTTDFVARFVDLDLEMVQRRLTTLGAACVAPRRLVRQAMLENDAVRARGAWVTVGSEGDTNALTLHDGRSGDKVEVLVADFGSARRFMEQIGFTAVAHRESYREEWRLQHIAFILSDWPGLPRSLEINGPQEDHVRWAAQNLGLDFAHAVIGPDQFAGVPETPPPPQPVQAVNASFQPVPQVVAQEVEGFNIVDLGWSASPGFDPDEFWVNWVMILENPNRGHYCEFPTVQVTARDQDNYVVGTDDQVLHILPPGGRLAWAGSLSTSGVPHTLHIAGKPAEWHPTSRPPEHFLPFGYQGVRFKTNGDSCIVTGEITNPYPQYVEQVVLTALFRDAEGDLVGGEHTYIKGLNPNGATPFSLEGSVATPVASLDLMAAPWSSGSDDPWEQLLSRP